MVAKTAPEGIIPVATSFKLKAGFFPLTVLELINSSQEALKKDLRKKVAEAPSFFQNTPVLLNTEQYIGNADHIDLAKLQALCLEFGIVLMALRSNSEVLQHKATALGIGVMASSRKKKSYATKNHAIQAANSTGEISSKNNTVTSSKVVTSPVRSGQQVYAANTDLIVMASVSAGAEVLADGDIHVYGAMRGRALAGVQGNKSARIICQSLEAQLISIAGCFSTEEILNSPLWQQAVHICRVEGALSIEPLLYQPG